MTQDEIDDLKRFKAEEVATATNPQQDLERFKGYEGRGNMLDAIAREMSFGFNDEFGGAATAGYQELMPESMGGNDLSFGENYTAARDDIRGRAENYRAGNPWSDLLGSLIGGGAGGAMVGGPLLIGKTGLELIKTGIRVGGLEGAAQTYGNLKGDEGALGTGMKMAEGAAYGGLAGAAAPILGDKLKDFGRWAWDKSNFDTMTHSRPAQFIKDLIGNDNDANIVNRAAELGPDSTFVEAMNSGVTAAHAALQRSPKLFQYAEEGISNRLKGATGRVARVVEGLTGQPPPQIDEIARLSASRATNSNPQYAQFENLVPEYNEGLDALLKRPSMVAAWKRAKALAKEKGDELPELFEEIDGELVSLGEYPNFKAWDYMKSALWDVEQGAYKDFKPTRLSSAFGNTRRELTRLLDDINPNYAAARESWGIPSQDMDMIDMGRTMFNGKTNEVVEEIRNMSPRDKSNYLTGVWEEIQERMGRGEEGMVGTYKFLNTENTRKKLRALFPAGEVGDANMLELSRAIDAEKRLRELHNKVIAGSQTGNKQAAERMLDRTSPGVKDIVSHPIEETARGIFGDKAMPDLTELGKRMFKPGGTQETLDWVNQIGLPLSQRNQMLGGAGTFFSNMRPFVTGAAGALPGATHPLDRMGY